VTVDTTGQVRFGFDRIAVGWAVRHLSLVLVDNAGQEDMVLEISTDAPQIGNRLDPEFFQVACIPNSGQHEELGAVDRAGSQDDFTFCLDCLWRAAGDVTGAWVGIPSKGTLLRRGVYGAPPLR